MQSWLSFEEALTDIAQLTLGMLCDGFLKYGCAGCASGALNIELVCTLLNDIYLLSDIRCVKASCRWATFKLYQFSDVRCAIVSCAVGYF